MEEHGDCEFITLDPDALRLLERLEDGEPAVGGRGEHVWVCVLKRSRVGLEPAVEELVEGSVLGEIGFKKLVEIKFVCLNEGWNRLCAIGAVVDLALLRT